MEDLLGKQAGSHHGTPDLFDRDIKLLNHYQHWVSTVHATKSIPLTRPSMYSADWIPSEIDMLKSRLFWRIRSGKKPLPMPPPTAFSCPWYELIEVPGPHDVWEEIRTYEIEGRTLASVAQCMYKFLHSEVRDGKTILHLEYNNYTFEAWNGMIPTKSITKDGYVDTQQPGGWIQYTGNAVIV